jgi:hypothetical protein
MLSVEDLLSCAALSLLADFKGGSRKHESELLRPLTGWECVGERSKPEQGLYLYRKLPREGADVAGNQKFVLAFRSTIRPIKDINGSSLQGHDLASYTASVFDWAAKTIDHCRSGGAPVDILLTGFSLGGYLTQSFLLAHSATTVRGQQCTVFSFDGPGAMTRENVGGLVPGQHQIFVFLSNPLYLVRNIGSYATSDAVCYLGFPFRADDHARERAVCDALLTTVQSSSPDKKGGRVRDRLETEYAMQARLIPEVQQAVPSSSLFPLAVGGAPADLRMPLMDAIYALFCARTGDPCAFLFARLDRSDRTHFPLVYPQSVPISSVTTHTAATHAVSSGHGAGARAGTGTGTVVHEDPQAWFAGLTAREGQERPRRRCVMM